MNATQVVYTSPANQFGQLISQRRSTTSRWYHPDSLGSTRSYSDASQATTDTYLYDAWGNPISSNRRDSQPVSLGRKRRLLLRSRVWISTTFEHESTNQPSPAGSVPIRCSMLLLASGMISLSSRDPSRYFDGYSLYRAYFVPNSADPTGKLVIRDDRGEWTYNQYWWWYWNNVNPFFDGYFGNSHGGCIGIVRAIGRKSDLFEGTKCFYFPGNPGRAEKAANEALEKLDCVNKFMFAFNSSTNGNNPQHPNHIKSCRQCGQVLRSGPSECWKSCLPWITKF